MTGEAYLFGLSAVNDCYLKISRDILMAGFGWGSGHMLKSNLNIAEKLTALRAQLADQGLDGFLVPRSDEYQGEFPHPYAERLRWISGFTGSAGMAVILRDKAGAFTDGRYLLQVAAQVEADHFATGDIMKSDLHDWIIENIKEGGVIGYDPWLHTPSQIEKLGKALTSRDISLKPLLCNPLDEIWEDQPKQPTGAVEIFSSDIAGRSSQDKCEAIARDIKKKGAAAFVITSPDSICWLLNVRGSDINYVPLVLSFAIIYEDERVDWFVAAEKIGGDIRAHLGDNVTVREPSALTNAIKELAYNSIKQDQPVWIDPLRGAIWFSNTLKEHGAQILSEKDPCILPKAIKTKAEQGNIKKYHIIDGVAVTKFLRWIDEEAPKGNITELDAMARLQELREEAPSLRGLSFPTISGYGANGAIIHYRATSQTNLPLTGHGLFLVDSGGQYPGATTDITRTIAIGLPSVEMRERFTLVLMGHIDLAMATFPRGTVGKDIDGLARSHLKANGLDYAHGTGHGVGCFLQVHEEAAGISPRGEDVLEAGMLISNEPGYYKEGEYGIRIESLVLVGPRGGGQLGFETVSMAPIDLRLIAVEMLSDAQKTWLNDYHMKVREALMPLMPNAQDQTYLAKATLSL